MADDVPLSDSDWLPNPGAEIELTSQFIPHTVFGYSHWFYFTKSLFWDLFPIALFGIALVYYLRASRKFQRAGILRETAKRLQEGRI